MPVVPIPQPISDVFLTQGVIGAVALLALVALGWIFVLWQKDLKAHIVERNGLITKYENALTLKDGMIEKIQETRMAEMRSGMMELSKAMQTVETVTIAFEAASDALAKVQRNQK